MKLSELVSLQMEFDALSNVTTGDVPYPVQVGEDAHEEVRQLLWHHFLNHEIDCPTLSPLQVEFMGEIYNQVVDEPLYQPTSAELVLIRSINQLLRNWVVSSACN